MSHPVIQMLSRPRVRIGLGVTAIAACAGVLALGAFSAGDEAAPRPAGPRLAVDVVAPVERSFEPGSTMDVGTLNDGFDRAALERSAETVDDTYLPPDAYPGDLWLNDTPDRPPVPTFVAAQGETDVEADETIDRGSGDRVLDDGSSRFGFDRPRPDYAAEREARWAAREAAMASEDTPSTAEVNTGPVQYSSE